MKRLICTGIIAGGLLTGCVAGTRDTSLYERTGQIKPIVSVMPVVNSSGVHDLTWDLSREFTDEIRKRVFDSSKVYLLREGGSLQYAYELGDPNPTNLPLDMRERLGAAEFVMVTELLKQEETPYGGNDHAGAVLSLAVRLRVIDLRKDKPVVVLQEIIDYDHIVAAPYLHTDYGKAPWGSDAFERTPYALAHSKIIRDLVAHAESYIIASR